MAGRSGDDAMAGLQQIEADIQLCEQFLHMDTRDPQDSASVGPVAGAGAQRVGDARNQAKTPAEASSSAGMSQQRRKEILDRLLAERKAAKERAAATGAREDAANGREAGGIVDGATRGVMDGDGTSNSCSGGGSGRGETREELIQRLIREKREREDRSKTGQGNAATSAAPAARDQRKPRQAWGDAPHLQGRSSSETDSLDSRGAARASENHVRAQTATAAQRRPASAARPASAPRQRMTNSQHARPGNAQDPSDAVRPQSARATSSLKQRPAGVGALTRPKSPNLSKTANMHSKERIMRQLEAEMREQLPLKPRVAAPKTLEGDPRQQQQGGERVEFLARSKRATWEARERAKLRREEDEQQRLCSFKPTLVTKGNSRGASPSKVPVEVRLLNMAHNKQALRQRAKRHLEEQELIRTCNGNSFRPKINEASRLLDRSTVPLHERIGQVQRQKQQKLHDARRKLDEEKGELTFKPALSNKSMRLAERIYSELSTDDIDLPERLQAQHSLSVHKRMTKAAEIEQERAKDERFQPEINRNSEKILEHSDKFAGKNFMDRQAQLLEKKLQLANASSLCREHSFTPNIGNASALVNEDRLRESSEERLQRLAYRDKDLILTSRQAMEETYYAQFNFKPDINPISKQLGQAHTIDELHKDEGRKQRFEALLRAKEAAIEEECTFKPNITKNRTHELNDSTIASQLSWGGTERSRYSIAVTEVETLTERFKEKEREKMAQCQLVKKKKEYEELKECTFTPAIRRSIPKQPSGPIVVRGLGRHLELKELAQRKAEEKAERERKAFLTNVSSHASSKLYTVPVPFQLSSNDKKHQAKKEQLRKAVDSISMAECTFHPRTNESTVRQLLNSILDQDPTALSLVR